METGKGRFGGLGDANPGNVNRRVAAHLIRMAETRAKARALRDAVNIGVVALEELGGEDEDAPRARPSRPPIREVPRRGEPEDRRPPANAQPRVPERQPDPRGDGPVFPRGNTRDAEAPRREAPAAANGAPPRMTENQRRYLYRFLADRGFEGAAATDALCRAAEVRDVGDITKALASELIDAWKQDAEGGGRAA